ncbi:MAG TPA: hypothetical protein VFM35_08010, partial [Candidatus Binatia bacterium]|nr:hypothetical protein [Candidatus Binatia bacterium]
LPAASRPAVVVSSSGPAGLPGGPAVVAQAAPAQLPFGGLSLAVSLFISMTRWVGAALVILGLMMYTKRLRTPG